MSQLVVADSSPLITLLNIGHLGWLQKLFSRVLIPPMVELEVSRGEAEDSEWFAMQQSGFIRTVELESDEQLPILLLQIDPGESEAILLAKQLGLPLLIDDKAGRKMAQMMDVRITGLVGILEALKRQGEISVDEMLEILEALERVEFRLSFGLRERLLDSSK